MPKVEIPMAWMTQSTLVDVAHAIEAVNNMLRNSPSRDFDYKASLSVAADKSSPNLFVRTLVTSWMTGNPIEAVSWARRVLNEPE